MKKNKKKIILPIVIVVLILALAAAGFAVVKSGLGRINRTYDEVIETTAPQDEVFEVDEPEDVDPAPAPTQTGDGPAGDADPTPTQEPEEDNPTFDIQPEEVEWNFIDRIEDDHLINILLVGQDRREGQGRQRSDTMILCSINAETGQVAMISFLRDLYVQIPGGYSDNRLNATYQFGGFPLLNETLTHNFGVSIDANFEVDFTGFEAIVDMLGGVDVDLTAAEAAYLSTKWGVPQAVEGLNHFDGYSARRFAQARKLDSDFQRTGRQREILLSIFDKLKGLPAGELLTLMYDMLPYLTTDLTDGEILSLAYRLIPMVSSISVESHSVPGAGCYTPARIRNMSVLVPDREKIRARLVEYLPLQP